MAREAKLDAQVFEHGHAYFAGESAAGFAVSVLRPKKKFGARDGRGDGVDIDKWRGDADVNIIRDGAGDASGQLDRAGLGEVHFPVAGNKLCSHVVSVVGWALAHRIDEAAPPYAE